MTDPIKPVMDVLAIQKLLPHRYPFLLVDRVIELVPEQKLVAYKNVSINEPFFAGHFPAHPVMPGVLILEALAQACALLGYSSGGGLVQAIAEPGVAGPTAVEGADGRNGVQCAGCCRATDLAPDAWCAVGDAQPCCAVAVEVDLAGNVRVGAVGRL